MIHQRAAAGKGAQLPRSTSQRNHAARGRSMSPCVSNDRLQGIHRTGCGATWPRPAEPGRHRCGTTLRGGSWPTRPVTAALSLDGSVPEEPRKLAIFVSGGGSNFKAIHSAILEGRVNAEVTVVVSDVPGCGGLQYAESQSIPTLIYPKPKKGEYAGTGATADQLVSELVENHKVDYVLLAGYLKLIPGGLVKSFKRRMVNIHPALLPAFGGKGCYGSKVHEKVVASGVRFTGPTVHFVDEEYDTGAIIAQRCVPVYPTDTPSQVAARVLKQEHQVFPEVVKALVEGRITFRESDGVPVIWDPK